MSGRIRSIRPDMYTDAATGTLSNLAFRLYLGLKNFADDYGVLCYEPLALKARIFPYQTEDWKALVETPLYEELIPRGLVRRLDDGSLLIPDIEGEGGYE